MNKFSFGISLICIISCNSNSVKVNKVNESTTVLSKIKKMEWVLGKWENKSKDRSLYEIWSKTNDTIFTGKSFMIANNDTVISESI